MKTVYMWGMSISAFTLLIIAAAANAQQQTPPPQIHSTPQPVTAYEPAAPGAMNRDDDVAADAAAIDARGLQQIPSDRSRIPAPSAALRPGPQAGIMEDRQLAGERSMMANGEPGELGVWLVDTNGAGVEVRRITDDSPAHIAGLQSGDIILQINGQGATTPQSVAQLIRRTPAGQAVTIEIWRDGQQQELQAMLRPAREYQTAYRGQSMRSGINGDLVARTMRLEEQLSMVMQELRQLRQEMAQLRAGAGSQSTTAAGLAQPEADAGFDSLEGTTTTPAAAATAAPATATTAPAADAAATDPFTDSAEDPAAENTAEPAEEPAAEEPAAETEDVFGEESAEEPAAAETEPAAETTEEPAAEESSDDLFN